MQKWVWLETISILLHKLQFKKNFSLGTLSWLTENVLKPRFDCNRFCLFVTSIWMRRQQEQQQQKTSFETWTEANRPLKIVHAHLMIHVHLIGKSILWNLRWRILSLKACCLVMAVHPIQEIMYVYSDCVPLSCHKVITSNATPI